MNKKLVIFLGIIGFTFGYAAYEMMKLESKLVSPISEIVIKKLPSELSFKSFETGEAFSFTKDNQAKIMIHFWATWCAPCEIEFPELVEFMNLMKERDDYKFFIVAVDDDDKKVKKFLSKFKIENKNVVLLKDTDKNFQKFGTYKLPETFLFNADYRTVRKLSGQQAWTQDTLVNYFRSL